MTFRTIALLALGFVTVTGAQAMDRKKKDKKKPATEAVQPVPADSFSYAMGLVQAPSLKQYLETREGLKSEYIGQAIEGIKAYDSLSEDERMKKIAFSAGLRIGDMNQKQVIPALNRQATGKADTTYTDLAEFNRGLSDGIAGTGALQPDSAMKIAERQIKYYTLQLKESNLAWLEANAKQKGVKTTDSGLQYRILSKGEGPMANDTSMVEVHYEGKLIDGTIFDSSYKRNQTATFGCNQVIKGWTEALKMMPEGSIWELYIPYDLAYGERGNQNIPPYSTLIFKVELIKVNPESKTGK